MYYSNQATNKAKQQITQNKTRLVTSKLIQSIVRIGETLFWKFDFVEAFHAFSYLSLILSFSLYLPIALYRVFFFVIVAQNKTSKINSYNGSYGTSNNINGGNATKIMEWQHKLSVLFSNNIQASACLCSFLIFSLARSSYFFFSRTVCLYAVATAATAVSVVDVVVFVIFSSLARKRLQHRKWMASLKKYATLWQPLPNNWIIHCENHRLDYMLMFIYTRIQWIITFYRMYIVQYGYRTISQPDYKFNFSFSLSTLVQQ